MIFKNDIEYYADKEYLSNSMLKDYKSCPHKFSMKHVTQEFVSEDKDYFLVGRALDVLITEGREAYEAQFEVVSSRRGRLEENLLTKTMARDVEGMAREVFRSPIIKKLELGPDKCQEIIAVTIDGVKRKGKLDYLNVATQLIVDFKTCYNLDDFDPTFYFPQLVYYRRLVREKYGFVAKCGLFVVEKREPYRSFYYEIDPGSLDREEEKLNNRLEGYKESVKNNDFPGAKRHVCLDCEFYAKCDKSVQTEPDTIYTLNDDT